MKYVFWLMQSMRGIRFSTVARIVIGVTQVALGLLMVWLSKRFIDDTIRHGTADDVLRMVLALVATVVGGVLLRQLGYYLTVTSQVRQTNQLRLRMFSSLFRRQLFDDKDLHSGDITSRLAKDIDTISQVSVETLPQMVITTIQLCGAFLMMRWFDERLAWALLVLTPLAIVIGKLVARRLRQMTLDIRRDESRIQMHVQEGSEYNAVLRTMGSEQWVTDRLGSMQEQLRGNVMRRTRFTLITRTVLGLAFGLGYLMAFVWGGMGLRNGTITFGVMTSFLQLVGMMQHPILQLLNMVPTVIHASASIDRLQEIEQQGDKPQGHVPMTPYPHGAAGISFDDVTYRYPAGRRDILKNFSHDFKPGSKTAIMGETGAGKTTLFRMMLGLIAPTSGRVAVAEGLRYVPQGNTLMTGTIRYNLLLAKPDATDRELTDVLHAACADFVTEQLPDGLDTVLGERGSGLSEGQAQRIAIARGLLCQGNVLLLDEISSALDEATERTLFSRLFHEHPDTTIILITHRSIVGELCDEVVTLVRNEK